MIHSARNEENQHSCEELSSKVIQQPKNIFQEGNKLEKAQSFTSFEEFVSWVSEEREGLLHSHLLYDVHLVSFAPPQITVRLSSKAPKDFPHQLQTLLKKKRNEVWTIAISEEIGHPSLHEKMKKIQEEKRKTILETSFVKTLMEAFPGTQLVEVKDR